MSPLSADKRNEILSLIREGLSTEQIAGKAGVPSGSVAAVRAHVTMGRYSNDSVLVTSEEVAKGSDLAGKEGGHVIVHTVGEGSDKTAHSVEWVGDKTVRTTEGTVEDVDKNSKTVAVKTADATKETFVVADQATVSTGKDVVRYSARGTKKGEHVTVYYTEEAGKKVAHVFGHL